MGRLKVFQKLCSSSHSYHYARLARKLTEAQFDFTVEWLEDHDDLPYLEFEYAVNRIFLDKPKPKNFAIICELLLAANTDAHPVTR